VRVRRFAPSPRRCRFWGRSLEPALALGDPRGARRRGGGEPRELDGVALALSTGTEVRLIRAARPSTNLGLGDRRANSVRAYLERLGANRPQLTATTRGALDAEGRHEGGWRVDRRVDLRLAN
jgi:hypothetical protein